MSTYRYDSMSFENTLEVMRAKVLCGDWYFHVDGTPSQNRSALATKVIWC